jgi:hypothetical protein
MPVIDAPGMTDASDGATSDMMADGGPDPMIQHTQATAVVSNVGPQTLTLSTPSKPGSLLVIALVANDVSSLMLPNGWIVATSVLTSGACAGAIAYLPNNPGGITSVMYTMPSLAPNAAQLTEWAGVATTNPVDAIGTTMAATGSTMQTVQTATATTVPNAVAIDAFCEDVNNPTYTAGPGWTKLGSFSNGPAEPSFITSYRMVPTPGVVSDTVTSSVNGKHSAVIAAFRP